MRWSKLRQRIEASFADSVRTRVQLHQTRYRKAHDQEGEFWITVDGSRVLSVGSMSALVALDKARSDLRQHGLSSAEAHAQAMDRLRQDNVYLLEQVLWQLEDYLNGSIDQIMESSSPIVRGLGLLDRRFGSRRLARYDLTTEHEFVIAMHKIRCEAEGLAHPRPSASCSVGSRA